jgi:predicted metalloprotease with PDZ domain
MTNPHSLPSPLSSRALAGIVLLGLVVSAGLHGGARAEAPGAGLRYRLSFPEARQRIMEVELVLPPVAGPVELVISRSSPGRYALHEFAKNVFDVRGTDSTGRALTFERPAPHRWRVAAHDGSVRVQYRLFGDRVDGTYLAVDSSHAHINIPAALMWVRGLEERPATIVIVPPEASGWSVATQLFSTADPLTFTAPNLAYLVDSPIEASAHTLRSFRAPAVAGAGAGPAISLALHADPSADPDRYVDGLRRIVAEEAAVFGEYPQFDGGGYTFLADYLPWAMGDGMEHRNSTVLTGSASLTSSPRFLLDTAAHEFFHAWNVERIRPRTLEPFDLESANVSGELWLAEGVTTYYEKLVMQRTGLATLAETLHEWTAVLNQVLGSPALGFRSAEEMSRMAPFVDGARPLDRTNWNYSYVSYYVHGAALGLGLDLALREHTGGRRSLDDFMRAMWTHHGRPGGAPVGTVTAPYTIEDVRARLADVAGDAAFGDRFIARYVEGHEAPDYAHLLALAGLRLGKAAPGRASLGPLPLEQRGSRLRIAAPVAPGTPLYVAGVAEDDEILAIDGGELTGADALERALQRHAPGSRVAVRILPRGSSAPRSVEVTLAEQPTLGIVPIETLGEALTPEQRSFRDAWLSSRAHGERSTVNGER